MLCFVCANPAWASIFFTNGFEPATDIPATDAEASRFLTQATFGPTDADVALVRTIGYSNWIHRQLTTPTTRAYPYMMALTGGLAKNHGRRMDRHLHTFMTAPDQLRQRMAFALSQIFVISAQHPSLISDPSPQHFAAYWDMLANGAFGEYATLLGQVTHHIAMGKYLSHFRNRKAGPGREPDENYAREVMQLFSVGLFELALDGSRVLDTAGQPIPAYTQATITDLAKVFTGFAYGTASNTNIFSGSYGAYAPMRCLDVEHDMTHKVLIGDTAFPAGRGCAVEVRDALNLLAAHPNAAPFLSRILIQRFTTSNPSPAYIRRVAQKFRNNGDNESGDLGAVIRQILLDPEARRYPPVAGFGKIREPLLRTTALLRAWPFALPSIDANNNLPMARNSVHGTQTPLNAPSVFNFYLPDFQPPGALQNDGIYAPELMGFDESSSFAAINTLAQYGFSFYVGGNTTVVRPYIDLDALAALPDARKIDEVDRRMLGGTMSAGMRAILAEMLAGLGADQRDKARSLILLTAASPEYALQR
jgi:uncharacterized protein (DUF1800 family)